jgi:hypothetical protein
MEGVQANEVSSSNCMSPEEMGEMPRNETPPRKLEKVRHSKKKIHDLSPKSCQLCELKSEPKKGKRKTFLSKTEMERHVKRAHIPSESRYKDPYICKYCDMGQMSKACAFRHFQKDLSHREYVRGKFPVFDDDDPHGDTVICPICRTNWNEKAIMEHLITEHLFYKRDPEKSYKRVFLINLFHAFPDLPRTEIPPAPIIKGYPNDFEDSFA